MAKLVMTFENNEIKKELFFRGKTFSYSMLDDEHGKTGNAKCFEAQFEETFGSEDEELIEAASQIDFGDEDELEDALAILSEYE